MAMEIYYLIESINTATNLNDEFPGVCELRYYGKENKCLYCAGTPNGWTDHSHLWTPYFVREYGYKRECDAKRNWVYKHSESNKYWKNETRIVRAWVRKDGKIAIG